MVSILKLDFLQAEESPLHGTPTARDWQPIILKKSSTVRTYICVFLG